ncbi:hypothetical protein BJ912DRAFT_1110489 [Pholiota molesta]|nr:hypothetical protein BJ912DRAFT_1110489 [Pholiota molesta]
MRDENMRVWDQLKTRRVVGRLWDVVGMRFPGSLSQFPPDLLESAESPNIYVTSPTSTSRYPPPLSMNMHSMHNLSSPNSSPTTSDFPSSHGHHSHSQPHSLSRQHSFQHVGYRGDSTSSTPLPSSPGSISMDLFDDGTHDAPSGRGSAKRQRLDESGVSVGVGVSGVNGGDAMSLMSSVSSPGSGPVLSNLTVPKKSSRARSDSAPLGYATPLWQQGGLSGGPGSGAVGRPRSGSGMMPRGVPNIGNMTRNSNASTPLLSITTADAEISR